jgi:single-stranded-DNA-specific exonuclease
VSAQPPHETVFLPGYVWRTDEVADDVTRTLAASLGLPPPLAALLAARGQDDPATAGRFLDPLRQKLADPLAIASWRAAAERLQEAIADGGEIVVFGDFDVDGVVATALLTDLIRRLGGRPRHFLPNRHHEGYGLTEAALARCLAGGTPALFVTVDCGMGATDLLAGLHARGIRLLVTDHHTLAGTFPQDCLVINPHQEAIPLPMRHLCGAGVAFQLASAVINLRGNRPDERRRLYDWLEAVAIATVADVVPLLGDNRTLVAFGLQALNRKPRVGLCELMRKSGISNSAIDSYHLGFILAPRLNAAGRMETAEPAFRLLTTDDADEARELAILLDNANALRKATEQELLARADEQLADWFDAGRHGAVVVGGTGWHAGTVGIVAARLMNRYHRPAAVIALDGDGGGHGSIRAGHAYHAVEALGACSPHLERMGGHARAAGFTLKRGAFADFREAFAAACFAQVGASACRPELTIDGWLGRGDLGRDLVAGIRRLEPFGEGHPRPCWGLRDVTFTSPPQAMGADRDHLRLNLLTADRLPFQAVWFRAGRYLPLLAAHQGPFDVAGEVQENNYGGTNAIQLIVRDVRLV